MTANRSARVDTLTDQQKKAARALDLLAKGLDPRTKTKLTADAVLYDPEIVRALFSGAEAIRLRAYRDERKRGSSRARAGQPWSEVEDLQLEHGFRDAVAVAGLAAVHQRSRGAIQSRLVHLGLTDERSPES